MTYIFWQNILSIHQSAFIKELSTISEVILISETGIIEERISHGWDIPEFGNATVITDPSDEIINKYSNYSDSLHIFPGINSFSMPSKAFKIVAKKNSKIFVQLEPYNFVNSRSSLRKIKYQWLSLKYGKKIDAILAISSAAKKCYKSAGFKENKLFDWAYFTESNFEDRGQLVQNKMHKILYVGSINKRKNILNILPCVTKNIEKFDVFKIVGNGPLENELRKLTIANKIEYVGSVPNSKISSYFSKFDLLILPSLFDGWGAVINEALTMGTRVLCSENCGASDLVKENRGRIFSYKRDNFETQFQELIEEGTVSPELRLKITTWSAEKISGKAAAQYFLKIVGHVYNNETKPEAPWL